ncbi:MAG: agmatinase [Methanobacteriota archaeon]|nr:MAG: agmatinase [Euryarchaeota archaeon]
MVTRPFADSVASYDDARVVLFGVPFDRTSSFRFGSRWAPDAIREASYNFETYMMDHGRDILDVKFHDLGNLEDFGTPEAMVKGVSEASTRIAKAGKIPLAIGGEHSIAPAAVRGLPKDVGVIGLDAHLDFRDSYHDDKWSHACSQRRIADHVGFDRTVYAGVRSFSAEEKEDRERLGLSFISAYEIHQRGIERATDRALHAIGREKVYLTIDTDAIDPAFAPAVGNPEPFGLTPLQVKGVVNTLAPRLVGMDINEVSPAWDQGQTALLAARLIREAIIGMAGPER